MTQTPTTQIYTLSLHDALPISGNGTSGWPRWSGRSPRRAGRRRSPTRLSDFGVHMEHQDRTVDDPRSEEHTSELQSQSNLVCRLLLEKKKKINPLSPHRVYPHG